MTSDPRDVRGSHDADTRFLLPFPVRTAVVDGLARWHNALTAAGVVVEAHAEPDLSVASTVDRALRCGTPRAVIVTSGRGVRRLRQVGFHAERLLVWGPSGHTPVMLVPIEHRQASGYALRRVLPTTSRWRTLRNALLAAAMKLGVALPRRTIVIAWRPPDTLPFTVAAYTPDPIERPSQWMLQLGRGDELQRAVFLVFTGGRTPAFAVKFARVQGSAGDAAIDRDRAALETLARRAPGAARHAPRALERRAVFEHATAVETAAAGSALHHLLVSPTRRERRLDYIDAVAQWIVDLAEETAHRDALGPELSRLARDVVPKWMDLGVDSHVLDGLEQLPAVLQHNDLGSWNIVVDDGDFTVVDWESSNPTGLPLWDLLYFLADALVLLDGTTPIEKRVDATLRLCRGEHRKSPRLFRWVHEGARVSGVAPELIGRVATLGWLHHGLSYVAHGDRLRATRSGNDASSDDGMPSRLGTIPRLATPWVRDPSLGPTWTALSDL